MTAPGNAAERLREATMPAVRRVAKVGAALVLWGRVSVRLMRRRVGLGGAPRGRPDGVRQSGVLPDRLAWQDATQTMRSLGLPTHPDGSKNWDTLVAIAATLERAGPDERVLDAGAALYSTFLPALRLYGYHDLVGINLEFGRSVGMRGVRLEHGDIEATGFADGSCAAIACLSVIEHGVDVARFLRESARVLRPGGVLVISTDYWDAGIDTTGRQAYGAPVRIFDRTAIEALIADAKQSGFELLGEPVDLRSQTRAVHWRRVSLDYTYVVLTFVREGSAADATRR